MSIQEVSSSHPKGSQAVSQLVANLTSAWVQQQPSRAQFWTRTPIDAAEDLSDEGLLRWRETLDHYQSRLNAVQAAIPEGCLFDHIVLEETQRFLHEQVLFSQTQQYKHKALPYLVLCAYSLLPFALCEHVPPDIAEVKLAQCLSILNDGRSRLEAGRLNHNIRSQDFAATLETAVGEFGGRYCERNIGQLTQQLADQLAAWKRHPTQPSLCKPKIDTRFYLTEVLEIPLQREWLGIVEARLQELIDVWNDHEDSFGSEPIAVGEAARVQDVATYLLWLLDVLPKARIAMQDTLERRITAPSFSITPRFLAPLVQDGLYLPAHLRPNREAIGDHMFMTLRYPGILSEIPLSDALRYDLAYLVTHEIFPGHSEHMQRSQSSPFKRVLRLTRSSLGMEGWALMAETAILDLRPHLPHIGTTYYFHQVRRFCVVFYQLARLFKGPAYAQTELEDKLRRLRPSLRECVVQAQHAQPLQLLPYVFGLLQAESVFEELSVPAGANRFSNYLAWGPIAPERIRRLARCPTNATEWQTRRGSQ